MRKSWDLRHVEDGDPGRPRRTRAAPLPGLDPPESRPLGRRKRSTGAIHVALAAVLATFAIGALGIEHVTQAAPAQRQAAARIKAPTLKTSQEMRRRFGSTPAAAPPGRPAQRVDDGHEPVTLRRRGIQELPRAASSRAAG